MLLFSDDDFRFKCPSLRENCCEFFADPSENKIKLLLTEEITHCVLRELESIGVRRNKMMQHRWKKRGCTNFTSIDLRFHPLESKRMSSKIVL